MPGWMGLRGLQPKTSRSLERERRDNDKTDRDALRADRSREKVQEILRDQQGDMSAFSGTVDVNELGDCARIWNYPVETIMSAKVAVLSFDDTLLTVQGIFSTVKFRHLPVVDDEGCIIGIISDRDFLRVVSPFFGTVNEQKRDKETMVRKVGTIMTRNPICAECHTTIIDAIKMMNDLKISCLPLIENEEDGKKLLLGIVTWKDIVRAFCPPGFQLERRLRQGASVNPATSESARLRARAAESGRHQARHSVREESASVSQRLAARVQSAGDGAKPAREAEEKKGSERISFAGTAPVLAGQEELQPRTAGLAGSVLAAKQRQRMRRERDDTTSSSMSEASRHLHDEEEDED